MTSNINPNNIDGAYPVAGQDNNSQGFRTNFTNTSTNFQFAADEITALQNTAVLTASLANSQPVVNNLQTSTLSNGYLKNMYETTVSLGPVTGSVTINYALGSYQTLSTNGAVSFAFSNFPVSGAAASVTVVVTVTSTAHTLQFPSAVSVNTSGIQGLDIATNTMEFAATGVYSFQFVTSTGGTTVTINQTNNLLTPFNFTTQAISTNAALSMATTSSYITAGNLSGTLATGADGQIKTIMASGNIAALGNSQVVVSSAGWKSSGTGNIVFSARGQGVTLQYINSAWFAIGNNGCTFS
jgi:hypothetical protein